MFVKFNLKLFANDQLLQSGGAAKQILRMLLLLSYTAPLPAQAYKAPMCTIVSICSSLCINHQCPSYTMAGLHGREFNFPQFYGDAQLAPVASIRKLEPSHPRRHSNGESRTAPFASDASLLPSSLSQNGNVER